MVWASAQGVSLVAETDHAYYACWGQGRGREKPRHVVREEDYGFWHGCAFGASGDQGADCLLSSHHLELEKMPAYLESSYLLQQ